jgi:guanylate kinase
MKAKLLLLLGPSGVGKSTLIRALEKLDEHFTYIRPYITRPLRDGEIDKICIGRKRFMEMRRKGMFLAVNEIYGSWYGTPLEATTEMLRHNRYPVLDWPLSRVSIMERKFGERLHRVYLEPPSLEDLRLRLADGRDRTHSRFHAAVRELNAVWRGHHHSHIDQRVVNGAGNQARTAAIIYRSFVRAIDCTQCCDCEEQTINLNIHAVCCLVGGETQRSQTIRRNPRDLQ